MDVELPGWIGDVGPVAGLLVLVLLAVVRGNLVPGRTVDRLLAEKQGMIDLLVQTSARWEAVADAQRRRAETSESQNQTLLAGLDTQTQLLRSIQQEAARRRIGS